MSNTNAENIFSQHICIVFIFTMDVESVSDYRLLVYKTSVIYLSVLQTTVLYLISVGDEHSLYHTYCIYVILCHLYHSCSGSFILFKCSVLVGIRSWG